MSDLDTFNFHSESTDFSLDQSKDIENWLLETCRSNQKSIDTIDFIFCSDDYLLEINKEYLNHDYYTDIITFPLGSDPIVANVFISVDRVKENAQLYQEEFIDELHRVMVHGILHLIGYGDKTEKEQEIMRERENFFLSQRSFV